MPRPLLILIAPLLFWVPAGAAQATLPRTYEVLEWSASSRFADDFEDGDFADGSDGETRLYTQLCGFLDDGDEDAGRLRLTGPNAPCNGVLLRARMPAAPIPHATIRLAPQTLPLLSAAGMQFAAFDGSGYATIRVIRRPEEGVGPDVLAVEVFVGDFWLAGAVFAANAAAFLASGQTIELDASGEPVTGATSWRPTGRFRVCPHAGCAPSVPWLPLFPNPFLPEGQGLLASGVAYEPYLFVQSFPGSDAPFSVDVLEWSYATTFRDDFSDSSWSATLPYSFSCAASEQDGALRLTEPVAGVCGGGVHSFLTGAADVRATFAWALPRRCDQGFGLSWDTDSNVFAADGVIAGLFRAPLPGVGDDVLYVALLGENPNSGPFEALVLSTTPGSDASLANVAAIELRVALAYDGATLRPHGQARLCTSAPCPDEAVAPLLDFVPYAMPQDDPARLVCGRPAWSLAPPPDGGAMTAVPHAPAFVLTPEPSVDAAFAVGIAALWMLRASRRASRLADCDSLAP